MSSAVGQEPRAEPAVGHGDKYATKAAAARGKRLTADTAGTTGQIDHQRRDQVWPGIVGRQPHIIELLGQCGGTGPRLPNGATGRMQLVLMPCSAPSSESALPRPSMPALAAA